MRNNFAKYPARRETAISGSGAPAEHLQLIRTPVLEGFNSDSSFGVRGGVQSLDTDQLKAGKPAGASGREISFGPFRLLPAQFLLLEGDKPVPLGSRALQMLIVLLERPGELVTKPELMARVWPSLFVERSNLSVHISALRRALRDGRDGNRFIINIPGRGYCFVAPIIKSSRSYDPTASPRLAASPGKWPAGATPCSTQQAMPIPRYSSL
jgi:DNA-binding winged helix-turn-helix (wHTH) protein